MSTGSANSGTTAGAVAHRILVVEDDPDSAEFLKDFLEQNRFRVDLAKDGGQAQSSFVMHKPDFVILDVILPGESGFEVCQRLKRTNETVPVLMLTAIDLPDARSLAERVGADGYVTKPYDPDELVAEIHATANRVWEKMHTETPKESTRVRFNCRCGKKFKVSASHRGKTLTCPQCGEPLVVPVHD